MEYKNNDSEVYKKKLMDDLHKNGDVVTNDGDNCYYCWRGIDGMRYRRRNKKQRNWKSFNKKRHQWAAKK